MNRWTFLSFKVDMCPVLMTRRVWRYDTPCEVRAPPSYIKSILQFPFECELPFGHTQVIWITIQPFTLKNINIFYFEMSSQIAIQPFSIKGQKNVHKSFGSSHSNSKRKRNLRHSKHTNKIGITYFRSLFPWSLVCTGIGNCYCRNLQCILEC